MNNITLYTMPNCPHCERAKEALDTHSIDYKCVSISDKHERHEFYDSIAPEMRLYPENIRRTMPKLSAGNMWVPSADDIIDMVRFGLL